MDGRGASLEGLPEPEPLLQMVLALGATAGLKPIAEQAIKDGYAGLKALIRGVVEEELAAAGADQDTEVPYQAEALLEAIQHRTPETAAAIGVDLQDIEGAALAKRIRAAGYWGGPAAAFDRVIAGRDFAVYVSSIAGISEDQYRRLAEEFGVTHAALKSFFTILERQQVSPEDLDRTLRQIATSYKDLQAKLQRFASDDPAVVALKDSARRP